VPTSANLVQARLFSSADVLKTPCFWLPGRHHSHAICCGLLQSARFRQTTTGLCHSPLELNKTRNSQRTLSCRGNHQSNSTLFLALVTLLDNIEIRFACVHSRQLAPRLSPDVQPRRAGEPSNHVPHGARQVPVRRDRRWRSNLRATNCSPKEGSEGKLKSKAGLSWPSSRPHPARRWPGVAGQGKRELRRTDWRLEGVSCTGVRGKASNKTWR